MYTFLAYCYASVFIYIYVPVYGTDRYYNSVYDMYNCFKAHMNATILINVIIILKMIMMMTVSW